MFVDMHFNDKKNNKRTVNKRTVQDGTFTFVLGTFPDKKNSPFQKFRNGNVDIPV